MSDAQPWRVVRCDGTTVHERRCQRTLLTVEGSWLCRDHQLTETRTVTEVHPGSDAADLSIMPRPFQAKVRVLVNDCWEWTGGTAHRYGQIKIGKQRWQAHRLSYTLTHGAIPVGLVMDHFQYPSRCIGTLCVNPDHVRPVTQRENILRSDGIITARIPAHPDLSERTMSA